MTDKIKLKRLIAREILIFFAGLVVIGIVWGFLLLRNSYLYHKKTYSLIELNSLKIQSDSLPNDYINEIYQQTSKYFVINYRVGDDTYAIPKEQEQEFLKTFLNNGKKIKKLTPSTNKGYSYFKFADDSVIIFDYIALDKFHSSISNVDYQDKFFSVFSNNTDQPNSSLIQLSNVPKDDSKPIFDPMRPYNGIFDLGTLLEFKNKVKLGLKYNRSTLELKNNIEQKIIILKNTISNSDIKLKSSKNIFQILIKTGILLGLLLYPLRFSVILIMWSLDTLKKKE